MTQTKADPYRVEADGRPMCDICGHGQSWTVVGPDGVEISQSFDNRDEAEDVAAHMNEAWNAALDSVAVEPEWFPNAGDRLAWRERHGRS